MTDASWIGRLAAAFEQDGLIPPLDDEIMGSAETLAERAAAVRAAVPWPLAGWKIGATGAASRRVLQTDAPFFGPVYAPRVLASGATVALPPGFLGFECEFALRLGAALPAKAGGYAPEHLRIAIDAVVLAIELVATRQQLEGMGNARRAAIDFGYNHSLVLGPALQPPPVDRLPEALVVALVDDVEVGRGHGRDVLGHPLEALAWLTRQGIDLAAGQVISTGTCTGIAKLGPGETATARFSDGDRLWGEVTFRAQA
ncbi:MAG: hypothetical protein EA356_01685 [Geminicoccaceae bacterium]|nr:MAG: hypothetical protein EA356_01685 [Geminicoccaceae bacterium]